MPEPDRISDPRDLVMNTAGAVLGVFLVLVARIVRRAGGFAPVPIVVRPGSAEAERELVLAASADRAA